jgi:pyruvate,water dikinase
MTHVLPLSGIGLADADRVGRKAAVLGELKATGFTVPTGFVVTVGAAAELSPDVVDEIRRGLEALGPRPVAVRSSGVDEDTAGMSYAGQYETVLNVRGLDAVLDAVRTCTASAGAERVATYRTDHSGPTRMAVLVQVMVDATAAGVAFSSNPLTGDDTEVVVNAVGGLGDRLVAGEVSAEQWTVRDGGASASTVDAVLDATDARAVAWLARRVAAHFGVPQDIEWAIADGTLWLLQARPITALPQQEVEPVPIEINVPDGLSTRNRSMDRPWTPMERSVFLPVFSAVARHIFAYTTGVVPAAHSIGGWTYVTTQPDTAEAYAARLERIAADIAEGRPLQVVRQWHETWKPAFAEAIAELRGVDLAGLSDERLHVHIRTVVALFDRLHDRYFQLTGAAIAVFGQLTTLCADLFGWSGDQTVRLRGGLAGDHMAATIRLSELARLAVDRPALRRWLARPDADPDRLAEVDPVFAAAFSLYIQRYTHRTVGFDLTEPTLAEQPAVLLALIRAQLAHPYDFTTERAAHRARTAQALAEARSALADRAPADRDRFEAALEGCRLSSPVRDEKAFYAVSVWALLRYAVLELGRRLVDRGAADRADDALFLELTEALGALSTGDDQRARIRHHRGEHAWALANPGPPTYGEPATLPTVVPDGGLSSGAQRALRAAEVTMSFMTGPGVGSSPDDRQLRGLAASSGRYLGPVRVIHNVTEFGKLRHGDVLICPETTAQWSLLFPSLGALVTDRGSLLSHPAILAREYGVPAVVATGNATTLLRDDQLVIVDGATGVVRLAQVSVFDNTRIAA